MGIFNGDFNRKLVRNRSGDSNGNPIGIPMEFQVGFQWKIYIKFQSETRHQITYRLLYGLDGADSVCFVVDEKADSLT